eukprot:CAMPEP_0179194774 /NCGR_PEP_ID=MMETSP0796-20121207/96812_1 /TAXON_ID=73915 /ORGANISM="Pyrodinium bahamense, Strain pbaha01" /LENGTH=82 /DNA_ID=CAMNT_0020899113 /DNA_START=55 /DNA_END=301 /DNA_ORIENTATION=-
MPLQSPRWRCRQVPGCSAASLLLEQASTVGALDAVRAELWHGVQAVLQEDPVRGTRGKSLHVVVQPERQGVTKCARRRRQPA